MRVVNAVQQIFKKCLQQLAEHGFSYPLTAREGDNLKPKTCMTKAQLTLLVDAHKSTISNKRDKGALNWESELYRTVKLTKSCLDNKVKMNL